MSVRIALVWTVLAALACQEPARSGAPAAGSAGSGTGSAGAGSAAGSGSAPAAVGSTDRVGVGPELPGEDAAPGVDAGPIPRFEDEARDEAWARETERVLRRDLGALPHVARLTVECRATQCRLGLAPRGGEDLVNATGELERALDGHAAHVVYGDRTPDGGLEAYAVFER